MNKTIKICLLVVAIVTSIGGVLYYYKTIVSPPANLIFSNSHIENIHVSNMLFEKMKKDVSMDSLLFAIKDKIELYEKEEFITPNERDELMEEMIDKYLPLFISSCEYKFNNSLWFESDHKWMINKISEVKNLKIKDNKEKLVQGDYNASLDRILEVIDEYKKAKQIALKISYNGMANAKNVISEAKDYANRMYLKNCKSLVVSLNEVPLKIEDNHFNYLRNQVNYLDNYRSYNEDDFKELSISVRGKLKEYKDNAPTVYGYSSNLKELEDKAADCYNRAMAYYESLVKPEINISYYPQWEPMISPSSHYQAYQSNSNYHISNSTSMMSFTIKGYKSFTFYIRSNGEANYDYVMVGINREPTINSNYASTKGYASSGTDFIHYKTVHLANLNKKNSYTIYVVYKKDTNGDTGTDRGYILLPYENN